MDIKQDPNAIPNYNSSGRIGELQPHEPEQTQSSVQLDPGADGDGAASGELSTAALAAAELDSRASATAKPDDVTAADPDGGATGRDPDDRTDAPKTEGGAVDGPVGAP